MGNKNENTPENTHDLNIENQVQENREQKEAASTLEAPSAEQKTQTLPPAPPFNPDFTTQSGTMEAQKFTPSPAPAKPRWWQANPMCRNLSVAVSALALVFAGGAGGYAIGASHEGPGHEPAGRHAPVRPDGDQRDNWHNDPSQRRGRQTPHLNQQPPSPAPTQPQSSPQQGAPQKTPEQPGQPN